MHLQIDHLSRLSDEIRASPVNDRLIHNNLFVVTTQPIGMRALLSFWQLNSCLQNGEKRKGEKLELIVNTLQWLTIGCLGGQLMYCWGVEVPSVLAACHDSACGGHIFSQLIGQEIFTHVISGLLCSRMLATMWNDVMLVRGCHQKYPTLRFYPSPSEIVMMTP